MNRILRWAAYGTGTMAVLFVVACVALYVGSERIMRRVYAAPAHQITVPTDSASIAEGERLAILRGCYKGCHGQSLEGAAFFDEPLIARMVAPNLTKAVRSYSDTEFERIVRHGVRPDGQSVFVMPSETFVGLSDEDFGRILAFLRSVPLMEGPNVTTSVRPLGRFGVLRGDFLPATVLVSRTKLEAHPTAPSEKDSLAFGRYLARSICTECHGVNLEGDPAVKSPNLTVVAGYSRPEFNTLLRTGTPRDGHQLGLMGAVARERFGLLTDTEVKALYGYLKTLTN